MKAVLASDTWWAPAGHVIALTQHDITEHVASTLYEGLVSESVTDSAGDVLTIRKRSNGNLVIKSWRHVEVLRWLNERKAIAGAYLFLIPMSLLSSLTCFQHTHVDVLFTKLPHPHGHWHAQALLGDSSYHKLTPGQTYLL